MKTHETTRIINDILCRCVDIGCPDFDQAKRNRFIVANGLFTTGYREVEEALEHTPLKQRLARWIPRGELPQVSKGHWQQVSGEDRGIHEIEELVVVGDKP